MGLVAQGGLSGVFTHLAMYTEEKDTKCILLPSNRMMARSIEQGSTTHLDREGRGRGKGTVLFPGSQGG